MEKIIIYGLGNIYKKYKNYLYNNYDVVGVTSSNEKEKDFHSNYISCEELGGIHYDRIFVCSISQHEIVNKLVNDLGISKEKIEVKWLFNQDGIFHSQMNEDAICLLLLNKLGINLKNMTYVDIGAHHPAQINNTYLFYLLGGHGVLVEPNNDLKNLIEISRPRDTLICKAISLDGEKKVFYKLKSSTLNTICYEKIDFDFTKNETAFEIQDKCEVETITINELLSGLEKAPDLMSLDIEGYNFEVLCQMDFKVHRPKIIIAELSAWGEKEQIGYKIIDLLNENDYILVSDNGGINGIFVDGKYKNEIQDLLDDAN